MIKSLEIVGLNGIEGNDIKLEFNEGLTIIVGKNGTGKTTILNILNSIITKSFHKLINYNFSKIILDSNKGHLTIINDESAIIIKRDDVEKAFLDSDLPISGDAISEIFEILSKEDPLKDNKVDKKKEDLINRIYVELSKNDIGYRPRKTFEGFLFDQKSLYFPTYRRLEQDLGGLLSDLEFMDSRNREYNHSMRSYRMLIDEINNRALNILSSQNMVIGLSNKDIEELLLKEWNKVTEFQKKRLDKLIGDFFFSLFSSKKMEAKKQKNNVSSSEGIEQLEKFFLQAGIMEDHDARWKSRLNEYREDLNWTGEFIPTLNEQSTVLNKDDIIEDINRFVTIEMRKELINNLVRMYSDSQNEISAIKKPIDQLVENVNVFLNPKKVIIDDGNIRFFDGNESVGFENLSAGEKQLVALFVYTQLATGDDSVIIIDEPELSLHVSWQRQLLTSLMSAKPNVQFIVSTHSPFIISSHRNNVILLDENWEEYY